MLGVIEVFRLRGKIDFKFVEMLCKLHNFATVVIVVVFIYRHWTVY